MIQRYFNQVKSLVDRYAAMPFVLDVAIHLESRPGDQGYLTGVLIFIDGSQLHFREFLDSAEGIVEKLMYTYHYQSADTTLIFRYDNALHRPALASREHKHSSLGIQLLSAPLLEDVLLEVVSHENW